MIGQARPAASDTGRRVDHRAAFASFAKTA